MLSRTFLWPQGYTSAAMISVNLDAEFYGRIFTRASTYPRVTSSGSAGQGWNTVCRICWIASGSTA